MVDKLLKLSKNATLKLGKMLRVQIRVMHVPGKPCQPFYHMHNEK